MDNLQNIKNLDLIVIVLHGYRYRYLVSASTENHVLGTRTWSSKSGIGASLQISLMKETLNSNIVSCAHGPGPLIT